MSIEVMKQALEALEWNYGTDLENIENCTAWLDKLNATIPALRQAIAEAEKQEPAFYVIPATDRFGEGYEQTYWEDPAGFPVYTRPVYASDISQERVDETAKREHEWVGLTDKEVTSIIREWHWMPYELCKVIEAKLKEKNT